MKSFPFFHVPMTGETVYSLFARGSARLGLPYACLLKGITCQHYRTTLLSALPGYLSRIAAIMPVGHPWRDAALIVRENTSLPYFIYFDGEEYRNQLLNRLATVT